MLNRVGLDPTLMRRYPHQFSGGQRARIGIARALAVKPEFLVCDESVAALDVSIQAQVLNLFMDLKGALNLTYLFISHDLGVVRYLSDRVVVMYLGRIVETRADGELFDAPNHPYTQALLAEVGTRRAEEAHVRADQGRDPVAARSAVRLPLPSPLSVRRCRAAATARPPLFDVGPRTRRVRAGCRSRRAERRRSVITSAAMVVPARPCAAKSARESRRSHESVSFACSLPHCSRRSPRARSPHIPTVRSR